MAKGTPVKTHQSTQKLRAVYALSEITSDPVLKAAALANLGVSGSGANLDSTFAIENTADPTKKIAFSASGVTAAKTATIAAANALDATYTLPPATSTLASLAGTESLSAKTLVSPVISTGLTASGSAANTFAGSTGTFVTSTGANTLSGATTMAAAKSLTLAAGTTAVAPLILVSGTNLTTAAAGATEFDGAAFYATADTTGGRGTVAVEQRFRLTATGSTISTIGNFFGATSNIPLVASGFYEIDVYAWFLNSTSGTVVWTLTNSAAPTSQNIVYEMSPAAGIVAPPGTATMLLGQIYNDATAALALTATAALTDAVNHYMHMKIFLQNGAGTSLKIQATKSAGTITPGIGSKWISRRLPAASTGAFAA